MDLPLAPEYSIGRLIMQRGVGLTYLLAFIAVLDQFRPLLGERGLLPAPAFIRRSSYSESPGIFHFWRYTDRRLLTVGWLGAGLSALVVAGITDLVPLAWSFFIWFALYALYLSIVNIGQTFYSFGWESLLLETGVLVAFLGNDEVAVPWLGILALRWLLFRVEFGAGMIKVRGDPCWRDLTCLDYHHETQPMPNPLSRRFHLLPPALHRVEVVGNQVAQLLAPFLLFLPQPLAGIGAGVIILTQGYLMISGNYAWLNLLTLLLAFSAVPNSTFGAAPGAANAPQWFHIVVGLFALVVLALSWFPAKNLVTKRQRMNYAFNRYRLVNTYGAFGSVTKVRYEVVVEGTDGDPGDPAAEWHEYGFRAKPTELKRTPPQWAPYHLRLDWLMWFAALSWRYAQGWLLPFLRRLLENDAPTLRLMRRNPFADSPPRAVRALYYRYRFASRAERRRTGAVWLRELEGIYVSPVE